MPRKHAPAFTPEAASASASTVAGQPHNLPVLQAKMKRDPEGYEEELRQLHRHFESSVFLFQQQAALATTSSSGGGGEVAKELGDLALFLAHVAPFYPDDLADLPDQIGGLLDTNARGLPPGLRAHLMQALILLVNRKIVDLEDTMELFMELQVIGDRAVKKLAFSHIVHSIRRMNQKHKNDTSNRKLQNILFKILQAEEESRAKRAFTILCDLHRRRVWFDERTTNAICDACFHPSSRIMIAAISFLLGYENAEQEDDSDASSSEDEADKNPQILLSKQDVYKANHKGTAASKKKKQAKLQRVIRSMKRQQRKSVEDAGSSYYSPLTYLKDAQVRPLFMLLQPDMAYPLVISVIHSSIIPTGTGMGGCPLTGNCPLPSLLGNDVEDRCFCEVAKFAKKKGFLTKLNVPALDDSACDKLRVKTKSNCTAS